MSLEDGIFFPLACGKLHAWACPSSSSSSNTNSSSTYQYRDIMGNHHDTSNHHPLSEKQCQRIMKLCLPIDLRHCFAPEKQSMLLLLMNNLIHHKNIKDDVLPKLLGFLENLDVHDALWLNCCESGFGYNFLKAIFQVILINGGNDIVVGFIMEKIQSLVASLHQTSIENRGAMDDADDTEGVLHPMSTLDKSRAILLQELFHSICSASLISTSPNRTVISYSTNDWIPHFQDLSSSIRTISSLCVPFTNSILIALTAKALNVGKYILKETGIFLTESKNGKSLNQQHIYEQLLEAVAFVHSSELSKENIQLYKIALLILLELNKYTTDTSLMEYTAQAFVKYVGFYPIQSKTNQVKIAWTDLEEVFQLIIELFASVDHIDGLLIVSSAISKLLSHIVAVSSTDAVTLTGTPQLRVFEQCCILLDLEYQATMSPTSICCNTISWLFDIINAALLSKEELSPSVGLCIDLLSIFTTRLHDKSMIIGTYKELLRLSQLPIYHNPFILKKFIQHILDIGLLIQDDKCINVIIFHILHSMEESVTNMIQLIIHVVFHNGKDSGCIECLSKETAKELVKDATEISMHMDCMSQCLATCCQHSSHKLPGMKRYDEWFRRLIDMLVRLVNNVYLKRHYDVLLKRCYSIADPIILCVRALLEPLFLFKNSSLMLLQESSSNEQKHHREMSIDDNIMTIRLWLSLFLIFVRCTSTPFPAASMNVGWNDSKQNLDGLYKQFIQLACVSPPVIFGSLLSTFGDSKKQYDIVDEILISDSTISYLVNSVFEEEDISWVVQHYLSDDADMVNSSTNKQKKLRRSQLLRQGKLSKQQYLYFIGVLHFLERNRIEGYLDSRLLLYYLQDASVCTKSSEHKKKMMINIVQDIMDLWMNKAFNHFVTLDNAPSRSDNRLVVSMNGALKDEGQFCRSIQLQLLFLFERCMDRRIEVRTIVSHTLIEALHKLHSLSKSDFVFTADGNKGILKLIEIVDFLQEISCNIARDAVSSASIQSNDDSHCHLPFHSILTFPEIAYPSNQNDFCLGCEELLYVAYIWLGYMDLSSMAPTFSIALQEHSSSSLIKAMIEEMVGNDTPVYHLQKRQEDAVEGRRGNSDIMKLLRCKAAQRAAEYKMKAFLTTKKKSKKISLFTFTGMSNGAMAKKYYKHHHLEQQRQSINSGTDDAKGLVKADGDIGGQEKLLHLLTSRYGVIDIHNQHRHPLSALLRHIDTQFNHQSPLEHDEVDGLDYIFDILTALSHAKDPVQFTEELLFALQSTERLLFNDKAQRHHRPIAVLQLWNQCLRSFDQHWMMISSFVLNSLTTFISSKLEHINSGSSHHDSFGVDRVTMVCLVLKNSVEMVKGIVHDKRYLSSAAAHDYHFVRTSMASFLSSWSNRENALTSFTSSSPLAMMSYNCKVSLCHSAFEVLRQSHGSHNEMSISCNRIYREQWYLSICFLLQAVNEESQNTASNFLFQFSRTNLHQNDKRTSSQWRDHAENATKECLEWTQILLALIDDSKKWKIEYDLSSLEHRNVKSSSTRMSSSTGSCQLSLDEIQTHQHHQTALDLCEDICGVVEAHQKPILLFGFEAFKSQILYKLGRLPSASGTPKVKDRSMTSFDSLSESFLSDLLNHNALIDSLRRLRAFGFGNLAWNTDHTSSSSHNLSQSGVFMLLYVLIHHRLDQLISRYALSVHNNLSSSATLQNYHTEDMERIRIALETLYEAEHKHGLPSLSSFFGQKDVKLYKQSIKTAWGLSPKLALMLKECFFELIGEQDGRRKGIHTLALFLKLQCNSSQGKSELQSRRSSSFAGSSWFDWRMLYPLLDLALSTSNSKQSKSKSTEIEQSVALQVLDSLPPAPLYVLLSLLSRCTLYLAGHDGTLSLSSLVSSKNLIPTVVRYVVRSLHHVPRDDVLFYLPQLVQLLRVDDFGFIHDFLQYQAESSPSVCHQLLWSLQTESNKINSNAINMRFGYCKNLTGYDPLVKKAEILLNELTSPNISPLSPSHLKYMVEEISFFNALTSISESLKAIKNKELHSKSVKDIVQKMKIPRGLYLPTNPMKRVVAIDINSAAPMQSAAKCPYLLKLITKPWEGPDAYLQDLIKQQEGYKEQLRQREAIKDELLIPIGTLYPSPAKKMMVTNPASPFRTTSQRQFEVESAEKDFGSGQKRRSSISKGKNVGFGENVKTTPSMDELEFKEIQQKEQRGNDKRKATAVVSDTSPNTTTNGHAVEKPSPSSEPAIRVPLRSRKLYRNPRLAQSHSMVTQNFTSPQRGAFTADADNRGGFTSPKVSFRSPSHNSMSSISPINASLATPHRAINATFGGVKSPISTITNTEVNTSISTLWKSPQPQNHPNTDGEKSSSFSQQLTSDACIFKVFDDCRQDVITLQVIRLLRNWFELRSIPVYLMPYNIISNRTGPNNALGGIVEVVPNVMSRDQLGKAGVGKSLKQYYLTKFGPEGSEGFHAAQLAFASSLAAYSVVCYLLHIKDRHNGNILIDEVGHLIHIDYGFILGPSPGRNLGFEMAPFKLSKEMVELMGGVSSEIYHKYCNLAVQCFLAAREVMLPILSTVVAYADSDLPCFQYKESVLKNLKNRFVPQMTDIDAANQMKNLIEYARQHWTTAAYDGVQKLQNNIFSEEWR